MDSAKWRANRKCATVHLAMVGFALASKDHRGYSFVPLAGIGVGDRERDIPTLQ
jgi:hypothetical protein